MEITNMKEILEDSGLDENLNKKVNSVKQWQCKIVAEKASNGNLNVIFEKKGNLVRG